MMKLIAPNLPPTLLHQESLFHGHASGPDLAQKLETDSPVYLMHAPSPWYGVGQTGKNPFEIMTAGEPRNPQQALREWIGIAQALTSLGAFVCVTPPFWKQGPALSEMVYMAETGELFEKDGGVFLQASHMLHDERFLEVRGHRLFWKDRLGIPVRSDGPVWEGQADISKRLPKGGIVLTDGVRTTRHANRIIERLIWNSPTWGSGSLLHATKKDPAFHGNVALNIARNTRGECVAIYSPSSFEEASLEALETFLTAQGAILFPISAEETIPQYVANSHVLGGKMLILETASEDVQGRAVADGFDLHRLGPMPELLVKGGGSSTCCVFEIRGDFLSPENRLAVKKRLVTDFLIDFDFWQETSSLYPTTPLPTSGGH